MDTQAPTPTPGTVVRYCRRANVDDEKPVNIAPLSALVVGVGSRGGLNLAVLGEGSESDMARGRRGSVIQFRAGVLPRAEAERVGESRWYEPIALPSWPDPSRLRWECHTCQALEPLSATHCSACSHPRLGRMALWYDFDDDAEDDAFWLADFRITDLRDPSDGDEGQ